MTDFIHLAPENVADAIRRGGIAPRRRHGDSGVVFAMPLIPDRTVVFQWRGDLGHHGSRSLVAVQFRLPDGYPVRLGHYGALSEPTTAAEASGRLRVLATHGKAKGVQVVFADRVPPGWIRRITPLSPVRRSGRVC
ncbi:MAG: hypothetical protein R3E84_21425 [Pseudomonadales bacterium]